METDSPSENRFNYIMGLVNIVAIFFIVWLLWYVFLHADGIFRLYTPMYGFSLVVVFLSAILLIKDIFGFYPFAEKKPLDQSILIRGILLTITAVVLMLFLYYVVFWNFLGKFGITYFNPYSIIAAGSQGAEIWNAREISSRAILYFFAAFLWITITWSAGFGRWPWQQNDRSVLAWSRLFTILFWVVIAYTVFFHASVCHLFYPAQVNAGVEPWWIAFADTGSANFSLALLLCALFWAVSSDLLWEGYPFKLLEKKEEGNFLKGIFTFFVTAILGIIMLWVLLKGMIYFWDEPFMGGQYTDGPDFRFLHAAEISGFLILSTFILKNYFNNFPNTKSIWLNAIVRTLLAIVGGVLFHIFYYSNATVFFLGKVPGIAQPDDTPLVWTILFLSIIVVHRDFFEGWPLKKTGKQV
jgi:amino acid transporter, AAT family